MVIHATIIFYRHVGILYIKDTEFRIDPIPLKTVRPFVMDTVVLSKTGIDIGDSAEVLSYLAEKVLIIIIMLKFILSCVKVDSLIAKCSREFPDSDKWPLIRLKVS